ncbi:MAG: hypothetical protein ABIJ34_02800 [archaeon]
MVFERLIEWYKYLLTFSPQKYIGILIMGGGPLYLFYRHLFFGLSMRIVLIGIVISIGIGSFLWLVGWDPYA